MVEGINERFLLFLPKKGPQVLVINFIQILRGYERYKTSSGREKIGLGETHDTYRSKIHNQQKTKKKMPGDESIGINIPKVYFFLSIITQCFIHIKISLKNGENFGNTWFHKCSQKPSRKLIKVPWAKLVSFSIITTLCKFYWNRSTKISCYYNLSRSPQVNKIVM